MENEGEEEGVGRERDGVGTGKGVRQVNAHAFVETSL